MLMPVVSGLIVSVDAFFIGLSLGMQERCRFIYLTVINTFLFGLCFLGFVFAGRIYAFIPFDPDWVVGFAFIFMGLWVILQREKTIRGETVPLKTFVIIGLVMSVEAMFITMGITLVFFPDATFIIPVTVALAHFGYSALSFRLARSRYIKKIPVTASHVISGLALITYGVMALLVG
jgi:putative Mn2+ efflux pump MntP